MGDRFDASVARHLDNKLRPRPPREYICLVGGVMNTFNGWSSFILNEKFANAPNIRDRVIFNPMPEPRNRIEVDYYLNPPRAVDLETLKKEEWQQNGWSHKGGELAVKRGWKAPDMKIRRPETHDLYWANYVDPAARLYLYDGDLPEPHKRPQPLKGDIVTFFIYFPAYRDRQSIDWKASPFNAAHYGKTISAKNNPEEANFFNKPSTGSDQGRDQAPGPPLSTDTFDSREKERKRKEEARKAGDADKYSLLTEDDINFHILMRTTSANTATVIKRLKMPTDYFHYLRGDYGRGPIGTVYRFGALAKVFFFSDISEVVTYVQTGKWKGDEWKQARQNPDNATDDDGAPAKKKNYLILPDRPVRKDVHGRPLPVTTPWYKAWDRTPDVDRNSVKIHRFDYFGHADSSRFILSYGWKNRKGEWPDFDYNMKVGDLENCFSGKVLTHDASASLWGCSLGAPSDDGSPGIAQMLAEKYFKGGVVASKRRTLFHRILDHDTSMPEPVDGVWTIYPESKAGIKKT